MLWGPRRARFGHPLAHAASRPSPPRPPQTQYPELLAHHARVAALPGVKEYLSGPDRLDKVNNSDLG
jgi:hypothetical protein